MERGAVQSGFPSWGGGRVLQKIFGMDDVALVRLPQTGSEAGRKLSPRT